MPGFIRGKHPPRWSPRANPIVASNVAKLHDVLTVSTATTAPDLVRASDIGKVPHSLFRFCDCNGLKTLVDGTLKVTPPREFNDPFEFSPGIDPEMAPPPEEELRRLFQAHDGLPRALYYGKHGGGNEETYNAWIEEVVLRHPEVLPGILRRTRQSLIDKMSRFHGVACFSAFSGGRLQSPEVVRHWANYADDHRGLAVEFGGEHLAAAGNAFLKVDYEPIRPHFDFSEMEDFSVDGLLEKLRRWARVKSCAWSTEEEWRLIVPLSSDKFPVHRVVKGEKLLHLVPLWNPEGCPEHKKAKAQVIRRVILGSRASKELEASVLMAVSQPHLRHVDVDRAEESENTFSVKPVPIRRGTR